MKVIRCSVDTLGEKIPTEQLGRAFERGIQAAGYNKSSFEENIAVLQNGPKGFIFSMSRQSNQDLTLYCLVHGDASDPIFFSGKSYSDIYIATVKNTRRGESRSTYEEHLRISQVGIFKFCETLAHKTEQSLLGVILISKK